MQTIAGILLGVLGLTFLMGAIRAWPPGSYRGAYAHASKISEIVVALTLSLLALAVGAWLLFL